MDEETLVATETRRQREVGRRQYRVLVETAEREARQQRLAASVSGVRINVPGGVLLAVLSLLLGLLWHDRQTVLLKAQGLKAMFL